MISRARCSCLFRNANNKRKHDASSTIPGTGFDAALLGGGQRVVMGVDGEAASQPKQMEETPPPRGPQTKPSSHHAL